MKKQVGAKRTPYITAGRCGHVSLACFVDYTSPHNGVIVRCDVNIIMIIIIIIYIAFKSSWTRAQKRIKTETFIICNSRDGRESMSD